MTLPDRASAVFEPLPARADTLPSLVFTAIRDRNVDSSIPPGSRVGEAALAAASARRRCRRRCCGCGTSGSSSPGRGGLRVVEPSAATIRTAFELRTALEPAAARTP